MSNQETNLRLPKSEMNHFMQLGDQAGKNGLLEESLSWYMKGLSKAKEIKDDLMAKQFSSLIMLSL